VLRNGRVTGSISCDGASEEILINMMFEKHLSGLQQRARKSIDSAAAPVLELRGVHTHAEGAAASLAAIDLQIHAGEIVGVAGVSGNGQKELCDVVLGMETCTQGQKYLDGRDYTNCPVQAMRRAGVSFIPENPLAMASVPYMTVLENMALTDTRRYARRAGFSLDWKSVASDMQHSMGQLGFNVNLYSIPKALSGGNLQRMVIVREMTHAPRLIIASYLTRGLDVQSALAAQQALAQAAEAGAAVLLVSEDLEELFTLSDRLVVLYGGRIVGQFRPEETDIYEIGHLMTGSKVEHGTQH
jgi:simple sugar transport system ATP-binding protein